jgi:Lon protease-like protein
MPVTETSADTPPASPLPLFPLQTVLFPGGRLGLKVFEARYLDLIGQCLRGSTPFGVVCLRQGSEAGRGAVRLEDVGTLATIVEVDGEQPGILKVRGTGGPRFRIAEPAQQQPDGLWQAVVDAVDDDPVESPAPPMMATVTALGQAIRSLQAQDALPFDPPFRLDEAGWVANRWCEILPISLAATQRLMALESPSIRLQLVDEYLRGKQVVSD